MTLCVVHVHVKICMCVKFRVKSEGYQRMGGHDITSSHG